MKIRGLFTDTWQNFESQIRRVVDVAKIVDIQQRGYLQLHLKDDALRFFLTLEEAIRNNFDNSLVELRTYFNNINLVDTKIIQLEALNFNPKTSTPIWFHVKLQFLAKQALPDPIFEPRAPADPFFECRH